MGIKWVLSSSKWLCSLSEFSCKTKALWINFLAANEDIHVEILYTDVLEPVLGFYYLNHTYSTLATQNLIPFS